MFGDEAEYIKLPSWLRLGAGGFLRDRYEEFVLPLREAEDEVGLEEPGRILCEVEGVIAILP